MQFLFELDLLSSSHSTTLLLSRTSTLPHTSSSNGNPRRRPLIRLLRELLHHLPRHAQFRGRKSIVSFTILHQGGSPVSRFLPTPNSQPTETRGGNWWKQEPKYGHFPRGTAPVAQVAPATLEPQVKPNRGVDFLPQAYLVLGFPAFNTQSDRDASASGFSILRCPAWLFFQRIRERERSVIACFGTVLQGFSLMEGLATLTATI